MNKKEEKYIGKPKQLNVLNQINNVKKEKRATFKNTKKNKKAKKFAKKKLTIDEIFSLYSSKKK